MGSSVLSLLAKRDVNVVCVDLDEGRVAATIAELGETAGAFIPVGADVTDAAAVDAYVNLAVDRWGGIDGLFNVAGIEGDLLPVLDSTIEDFDQVMRVNMRSVFLNVKFALPHLVARGGGSIVSTGSFVGIRGHLSCGSYGASKHAVVGFTRTVALEMAPWNVRANVLNPGIMQTRMAEALWSRADDPAAVRAALESKIPQGRFAQPRELAETGVWLLLDAPSHLTGQAINVDGARSAGG
jgi:3alpha(or 20beta)-hydroxysteroid dehydrogenase